MKKQQIWKKNNFYPVESRWKLGDVGIGFDHIRPVVSFYGNESFIPTDHVVKAFRLNSTGGGSQAASRLRAGESGSKSDRLTLVERRCPFSSPAQILAQPK